MLNADAFIKRLEELMDQQQLSAAALAEKIGVQRSSVSHILSKRNKPSLEFILKIEAHFETVSFDWLLLGISKSELPPSLFSPETNTEQETDSRKKISENTSSSPNEEVESPSIAAETTQIIQTYKDGTFRVFLPKS